MLSQDKDQNICHFYLKKSNSAHLQGNGVIDSTPQWKTVQINVQRRKEMMVSNIPGSNIPSTLIFIFIVFRKYYENRNIFRKY